VFHLIRKYAGMPLLRRSRKLARRFREGTARFETIQHRLLLDLVRRHADSAFGRDHHFGEIRTADDYRRRVPIRGYDGHEPYLARVRQGETGALFGPGTEVLMFAMTSGTTAQPKTIPVTRESLQNYRAGWLIWGIQAFDAHHEMLAKGLRPILQFNSNWREMLTPSGVPCGAITGLTAQMQNRLVRLTYCMPPATMLIKDIEAKYYTALRLSIHRNLGTIIAANPSTLLAMARLGDREKQTLIRDLFDGTIAARWEIPTEVRRALAFRTRWKRKSRARELEQIVETTGHLLPRDYWPNLCFLANWTGGVMSAYLRQYPDIFGSRPIRDVGLIASEGRMTVPIDDSTPAGLLDYWHQYFEFIPEDQANRDDPDTLEGHELQEGKNYFILLTTAGGLHRYNISDLVRCVGFMGQTPLIEFLNKGAHFSSLTGEKLSEFQVVEAARLAQERTGITLKSFLLLPTWGEPPFYSLLVEDADLRTSDDAERIAAEVEAQLTRLNVEYENKRDTRRLGPIQTRRIANGSWAEFKKRRLAKSGGTAEQYKQPCLMPDLAVGTDFLDASPSRVPHPAAGRA
jgi:hypothetical protein